jgi:multidrug resistance efflux pump
MNKQPALQEQLKKTEADLDKAAVAWDNAEADWGKAQAEVVRIRELIREQK